MVEVRAVVRRYRECEHTDTLSGMPGSFRDALERAALRRFVGDYVPPRKLRLPASPGPASAADGDIREVVVAAPENRRGALSIALYARDYREVGRWVPRDAAYVIGRYMFEADKLPETWAAHCNRLDEVWVPSAWQREALVVSGVDEAKVQVMPEAVDVDFFNPVVYEGQGEPD